MDPILISYDLVDGCPSILAGRCLYVMIPVCIPVAQFREPTT